VSGGAGKLTGHFDEAEVPVSFRQSSATAVHKLGTIGATDFMMRKNITCCMPVPCHSDSPSIPTVPTSIPYPNSRGRQMLQNCPGSLSDQGTCSGQFRNIPNLLFN
jgi:hypothetical protein